MLESLPENRTGADGPDAGLADLLNRALTCLDSLGDDYTDYRAGLEELRQRLSSGRFRLAVLGQFKRGKSTLLNALLGENLLPTDILPVTAIPTYILPGERLEAEVFFEAEERSPIRFVPSAERSLADFLGEYVTEAGNPNNRLQVDRVEINHPAPLLQQGVVLVDTPGIGSTHRHNTEVAYRILPQCDAALFLVSPDPPITEAELEYLKDIHQSLPRTFFLLNKVDFLDEQERLASLQFLSEQLRPICQGVPQILDISARKGLKARLDEDPEGWKKSGMRRVEKSLVEFFAHEKKQVFCESLQRRVHDQLNNLHLQLQLSLSALLLPETELKDKIAQFRQSLPAIEREKQAAEDILSGDHDRIVTRLNEEVAQIRARAREAILARLESQFLTLADTEELERVCRDILKDEIPVFFAPEMRKVGQTIQQEAIQLLTLHQQRCDELIEKVRQLAAELFAIPYQAPAARQSYLSYETPSWSSQLFISDMDPIGQKLSRKFLTRKYRHRKTVKRLREEGTRLLGLNVEQISWTLRRGIDESFRKYQAQLGEQLDKTVSATREAMEIALNKNESLASINAAREIRLSKAIKTLGQLLPAVGKESC